MKNILFVIDTLYQGGAETLVKDYALLLDKSRFSVSVLCLKRVGSKYESLLQENGIDVFYLSDYFLYRFDSLFGKIVTKCLKILSFDCFLAKKIIKRKNVNVIHAHLFTLDFLKRLNPDESVKLIYTVHNEPQKYWHGKTRLSRREFSAGRWLVSERKMHLIALHDSMRDELNGLFRTTNTTVVNNGIDFSRFDYALSKPEIRAKLQIDENAFVVGHVGRFVEQKNHFFLLDVFGELYKIKNNSILLLVGTGPLLSQFKEKVNKLALNDRVVILGNRSDIPDLMNAMDVFAFPSIYEGLGIVLIEAQKMGVPCVISDKVPAAAIISNLVTKLSLTSDKKMWIGALCKDKPQTITYKKLEEWNMQNVVKQLENLYLLE